MNVASAWQKGYTGKGVVVSILDDGIQTNHPDLAQNYVSVSLTFLLYLYCEAKLQRRLETISSDRSVRPLDGRLFHDSISYPHKC